MAKKDFTQVKTEPVYDEIAEATAEDTRKDRKTYTEEEAEKFKSSLKTGGRKGLKLPRINLALTPENYDYVKVMSSVTGATLAEFINAEIEKSLNKNRDIYEQAVTFREKIKESK